MSTKQTSGKSSTPKSLTITIAEGENGWVFVLDGFGDYRGVNEAMGLRTRLKFTLEWAKTDVSIERLQVRSVNGEWIDGIDRPTR